MRGFVHDSFTRDVPGGGTETIGCITALDAVFNATRKREMVSTYGGPTNLQKISHQNANANRAFPYDGAAGTLGSQTSGAANGNALLALPSDVLEASGGVFGSNVAPDGLLVCVLRGSNLVVRVITGVSSGLIVTVNRNWNTSPEGVPASSDWFTLLYPIAWMNRFHLSGDVNNSATPNPTVIPVLYDWGINVYGSPANPIGARKPFPLADRSVTLGNLGVSVPHMADATRYALIPYTQDTRGFMGMKVYVSSLNGATGLTLFAGAS